MEKYDYGKPSIFVNLITDPNQTCVCNLDKYFFYPLLNERKDREPWLQMYVALTSFLNTQRKIEWQKWDQERDEFPYFNGSVYGNHEIGIHDIFWEINLPHSEIMEAKLLEMVEERMVKPLKELLDRMNITYYFFGI